MLDERAFLQAPWRVWFWLLIVFLVGSCAPEESKATEAVVTEPVVLHVEEETVPEQTEEILPVAQTMEHYAPYLGDLSAFEAQRESFPPDGSEGATRTTYLNTDITRLQEIDEYISFGVRTFRLLADIGYPEAMVVTRVQWDPYSSREEFVEVFREQGIFLRATPGSEWVVVSNELGFQVERLESALLRFDEKLE